MKYSYLNLFMLLVAVLVANSIFKTIDYEIIENDFIFKTSYKLFLGSISILLIYKFESITILKPTRWTIVYTLISMALIILAFRHLNSQIDKSNEHIEKFTHLSYLFYCLSTGIFEELLFRIFVFYYLLVLLKNSEKRVIRSIIYSAAIFSLAHFGNMTNPEYEKLSVIIQVVFSFSIGVFFQCLYLRYKSIVLIASLHGLTNYLGMYKSVLFTLPGSGSESYEFSEFLSSLVFVIIFSAIVLTLCRILFMDSIRKFESGLKQENS